VKGNPRVYIGVVVLAVFGVMAVLNFNKTVAPYVSFVEARAAGSTVQVAGFPDHQRARFDPGQGVFLFSMSNDEGEVMPVAFKGVKPGNFDQAEKVVVVGRYEGGTLQASQILVKCPSKYDDLSSEDYQSQASTK
jgi:cytochrome c-type biogenesis protein CcmE